MTRTAYFDCFAGASGDMILGAFLDAGLSPELLREDLERLNLPGWTMEVQRTEKQSIAATKVDFICEETNVARHLTDIIDILESSSLEERICQRTVKIFRALAKAEAGVHGTTPEKVHFHEVGAMDAILDITGAAIALERMGIEKVYASPLHTGTGFVKAAHGLLPVPVPATVELLKNIPLYSKGIEGELVTPTGAAILATTAHRFGLMPPMVIEKTGYGAGTKDLSIPNLLRLHIGTTDTAPKKDEEHDTIVTMECNIDDMNPELLGHLFTRLYEEGALEVYTTAVMMKKSRQGTLLTILAPVTLRESLEEVIFEETTTSGIRHLPVGRTKLRRTVLEVSTPYGSCEVKVHHRHGKILTVAPEYECCRELAEINKVPLKKVYESALVEWQNNPQIHKIV